MAPYLPVLPDELVEEILLRFPPTDPASLVRAALVCKRWRRLVSDAGFRRSFCEFHRTPPLLGVFCHNSATSGSTFAPTSTSSCPPLRDRTNLYVINARHGRVLLHNRRHWEWIDVPSRPFVVWDPITDEQKVLPLLSRPLTFWNAAVLCAGSLHGSCVHHLDCHAQPFLVFFVGSNAGSWNKLAYIYSSEDHSWSDPISVHGHTEQPDDHVLWIPSVLVGNILHFILWKKNILTCNLSRREMSCLKMPPACSPAKSSVVTTVDGGLGVASLMDFRLQLWSREVDPDGQEGWSQTRVIELDTLIPVGVDSKSLVQVASADGVAVIFMYTLLHEAFDFDLKSRKFTRIYRSNHGRYIYPYMSFYIPALGGA